MKDQSRVLTGGGFLVFGHRIVFQTSDHWCNFFSGGHVKEVPRTYNLNYFTFLGGRYLHDRGVLTLSDLSAGRRDCEVGQACLHFHCLILIEEIIVLSGDWARGRQADGPLIHLHGWILTRRGAGNWSHGMLRRSVVNSGIRRHHHISTLVEWVATLWYVLFRHVLLKVGLLVGDASLEVLQLLVSEVYFFLHPLS